MCIRDRDNSRYSQLQRAYQMGMLCHYVLDSNAHPYVHCFEKKLLESGIVPDHYRFSHSMLETNIDVVLMHLRGKTVSEFSVPAIIHKEMCIRDRYKTPVTEPALQTHSQYLPLQVSGWLYR